MKQGKTEKAVFAKLSKVELEEQKVELSVVNDIKALVKEMQSLAFDENTAVTAMARVVSDYRNVVKKADAMSRKADTVIKDAEAAARELGVNINEIEDLDKLKNLMGMIEKYEAKYQRISKAL